MVRPAFALLSLPPLLTHHWKLSYYALRHVKKKAHTMTRYRYHEANGCVHATIERAIRGFASGEISFIKTRKDRLALFTIHPLRVRRSCTFSFANAIRVIARARSLRAASNGCRGLYSPNIAVSSAHVFAHTQVSGGVACLTRLTGISTGVCELQHVD